MKNKLPLLAALALAALSQAPARADDHGRSVALLPMYVQECGSCHAPFPPGLLPVDSWQRLMNDLPRHFGTDASVDAATQKALNVWLTATPIRWMITRASRPFAATSCTSSSQSPAISL